MGGGRPGWRRLGGWLPHAAAWHWEHDLLLGLPPSPATASRWQLYLADWGYNTEEERAAAAALPGVRLLALPDFCELLRWGVVMGVSEWGGL